MQKHRSTFPGFQQTLEAVDPLSSLVYAALEEAAAKTADFFNKERQRHDPFLAPCLMRFFTKHALRASGIRAEEDGDASDFEALSNNGLAFFFKLHYVRILKAATVTGVRWKLPGCGTSVRKAQFYDQQLGYFPDGKGGMQSSILNVVYLWDFDSYLKVSEVHLACPRKAGTYAKDVMEHWCQPVPHPAYSRRAEKPADDANFEDALEELLRGGEEEEGEGLKKA